LVLKFFILFFNKGEVLFILFFLCFLYIQDFLFGMIFEIGDFFRND
jgi:hypothetical protein